MTVAAFTKREWHSDGDIVERDSECMLLNLTNKYSVKARDNNEGGICCSQYLGPSFGNIEL